MLLTKKLLASGEGFVERFDKRITHNYSFLRQTPDLGDLLSQSRSVRKGFSYQAICSGLRGLHYPTRLFLGGHQNERDSSGH